MKNTISISDFTFTFTSYGRYDVTYTSPRTGKKYSCSTTDMTIIDDTKNEDSPKIKDLNRLKAMCKLGQSVADSLK